MRYLLCGVALIGLSACDPSIPESGVGFGDYSEYRQQQEARDAALAGEPLPAPMAVSEEQLAPSRTGVSGTVPTAAQTPAQDDAARLAADTAAALNGGQGTSQSRSDQATQMDSPGISSENDFQSVSAERSIETDAERLARNRAQYQIVEPTSIPVRTGGEGPNIVEYALRTSNPIGTQMYKRSSFNTPARAQRNCGKYPSPDMAQSAFLQRGGPARDRLGLDPDGDGYACSWDPRPFRKAASEE